MNISDVYDWQKKIGKVRFDYLMALKSLQDGELMLLDMGWDAIQNFSPSEFDSPDEPGSGEKMSLPFIGKLDMVREILGCSVDVSSGIRTPVYNNKVDGHLDSYHLTRYGMAADIYSTKTSLAMVYRACELVGFGGLGCYSDDGVVHGDDRPIIEMKRWTCRFVREDDGQIKRKSNGKPVREYIYSI